MDDTAGRVGSPRSDQDETDIRTQEIREEIAQTRIEMSETIEAIEERLRPSNLVAQAGETVRNAASEKVKSMANTAGHAADRAMDTSFVQTVRANPIPAAMIGIGTAWLLMKGRSSEARRARARNYERYRTPGVYGSGSSDWRVGSGDVAVGTAGYADYGSSGNTEAAGIGEFGGEIRGYERDSYRPSRPSRPSMNFERVVRDNPLVVGAAAALVGVAIGMSIPASETENRLMGEARDNVVEKAREAASGAAEKVQDVAGKAAEAATQVRDAASRATGTGTTGTGTTLTETTGTNPTGERNRRTPTPR